MATSAFRNKNYIRPKKSGTRKRQRLKVQRRRLITLGVPEEDVAQMTAKEVREHLKHPAKLPGAQ